MLRPTKGELQGELQVELMHALWRLRQAGVEEIRQDLPARFRASAYNTVQTVLNRLAERGLVKRERRGRAIHYSPRLSEADYYSRSLRQTLAPVSGEARRTILAQLVGDMGPDERGEIEVLSEQVARKRQR